MGDEYEPYEWQIGDPPDWGDSIGVPDFPYLGYMNGDDDDERPPNQENSWAEKSEKYSDMAWQLRNDGDFENALIYINKALEIKPSNINYLNTKGIILDDMCRYEEAIVYFDRALKFVPKDKVILLNKANCTLRMLRIKKVTQSYTRKDLDTINEALKILPDNEDNYSFLHMKGLILESLGERVNAKICYLLASKMYDKVEKIESQLKILKNSKYAFIAITGTRYYHNFTPFKEGVYMDLVKEPDNIHDRDAIRVEIDGETVGYVANSEYTLIEGVKSASDIRNTISKRAKFMFILAEEYVIAKLV